MKIPLVPSAAESTKQLQKRKVNIGLNASYGRLQAGEQWCCFVLGTTRIQEPHWKPESLLLRRVEKLARQTKEIHLAGNKNTKEEKPGNDIENDDEEIAVLEEDSGCWILKTVTAVDGIKYNVKASQSSTLVNNGADGTTSSNLTTTRQHHLVKHHQVWVLVKELITLHIRLLHKQEEHCLQYRYQLVIRTWTLTHQLVLVINKLLRYLRNGRVHLISRGYHVIIFLLTYLVPCFTSLIYPHQDWKSITREEVRLNTKLTPVYICPICLTILK